MIDARERRLARINAAADYAAVSPRTIYRLIHDGVVPARRLGGSTLVDLNDLDDAMVPIKGGHDVSTA